MHLGSLKSLVLPFTFLDEKMQAFRVLSDLTKVRLEFPLLGLCLLNYFSNWQFLITQPGGFEINFSIKKEFSSTEQTFIKLIFLTWSSIFNAVLIRNCPPSQKGNRKLFTIPLLYLRSSASFILSAMTEIVKFWLMVVLKVIEKGRPILLMLMKHWICSIMFRLYNFSSRLRES